MRKKPQPVLLIFMAMSLACSFATRLIPSSTTTDETPLASSAQVDGFSAESTAEGSVLLKWEPISGAEQYLLEVQIGDEYLPLATLPADQTSYEDANVPPATRFTYRLSSLVGSDQGDSKELTVETPQEVSNPLQVSIEFDRAPAAIDPTTYDPTTIDRNNFDPYMYMAQPTQTKAMIGPQGGEISVTGSNGVIYTLSVPPDALNFDVTITLKPISGIPDLPLSGGLMAAVFIEPESLVFDVPATLTMTPPADFPEAAAPLVMAFAFETEGREFHLYPLDTIEAQTWEGGHLASLQAVPNFDGAQVEIAPVTKGGGYGKGSGTAEDAKSIAQNPPSNSQDRTEQDFAVSQLDELAPLSYPPEVKFGESVRQQASKADSLSKLMEALDNFSLFINNGGDKHQKLTDKILDLLVDKAKNLLEKNKNKCLTKEDFLAQDLVERLTNPKDSTSKAVAERFQQKHGQKLLDDLKAGRKACSFKLKMKSNIITDGPGGFIMVTADTNEFELFLKYSQGDIFLTGTGKMKEQIEFEPEGACGAIPIQQYPELDFYVAQLLPIFMDDKLDDFMLSFQVVGWKESVSLVASGVECASMINLDGGGDYWSSQFAIAQLIRLAPGRLKDWNVPGNLPEGSGFKAGWQSSTTPLRQSELTIIDDTKFELTITKNSR